MSATPQFGTQLIGQTENALGAILDRTLSGSGLTRQHWITLTVAVMSGGTMSLDQLVNRVTGFCRSFLSFERLGDPDPQLMAVGSYALPGKPPIAKSLTPSGPGRILRRAVGPTRMR
jgi:hypothetical protein